MTQLKVNTMQDIYGWFDSPLGQQVWNTELAVMEQLLPGYFGYHLLQLSVHDRQLYDCSPIGHKFAMSVQNESAVEGDRRSFIGDGQNLPFADDSIDVILLHHLHDFHSSPQRLLSEVARVSLPMGQLVIVGFNPISLWGLWKPVGKFRDKMPWQGDFIRPGRLMDWLNLLNFKIDRAQYSIYGPPLARGPNAALPDFSQGLSRKTNWPFGAIYVIVARKQVSAMIPMKPTWRQKRAFGQLSVVRPARPAAGRGISIRDLPSGD